MQPHIDARIETVDVDLDTALQNSKAGAGKPTTPGLPG
jgi:hypothetical protein